MAQFDWNDEKDEWLAQHRGISFAAVIHRMAHGGLLDIIEHPNQDRYAGQKIFIVEVDKYVYLIPFVDSRESLFLKTIIPSRKMTGQYLDTGSTQGEVE